MGSRDGQGSTVNAFEMLIDLLISEKLGVELSPEGKVEDPRVKKLKESILKGMEQELEKEPVIEVENIEPVEQTEAAPENK